MGQIDMKNMSSLDSFEIEKDIEQQIQEIVHQELEERTIKQFNSTTHENTNHSFTVMVKIFTIPSDPQPRTSRSSVVATIATNHLTNRNHLKMSIMKKLIIFSRQIHHIAQGRILVRPYN